MGLRRELLDHIQAKVGLSIEDIMRRSPDEMRDHFDKKFGKPLGFPSVFPLIGRGNVLRDGVKTSAEINSDIEEIVHD